MPGYRASCEETLAFVLQMLTEFNGFCSLKFPRTLIDVNDVDQRKQMSYRGLLRGPED